MCVLSVRELNVECRIIKNKTLQQMQKYVLGRHRPVIISTTQ